jgi:hypothetical protein
LLWLLVTRAGMVPAIFGLASNGGRKHTLLDQGMASKLTSRLESRAARITSRVMTAPGAKACGAPPEMFSIWARATLALLVTPLRRVWSLR